MQKQHERFAPLPSGDVVEPKTGLLGGKTTDREADVNSELTEQSRRKQNKTAALKENGMYFPSTSLYLFTLRDSFGGISSFY